MPAFTSALAIVSLLAPIVLLAAGAHGQNPPANDSCAGATSISALSYTDAAVTTDATDDPQDPIPPCGKGSRAKSVWYSFTTAGPGTIMVDTLGSNYDTILSAYTGACGNLVPVPDGCNDDDPRDGAQSRISFLAEGETTYFFLVSAYDGDGGSLVFQFRFLSATVCVGDCDDDGVLVSSECNVCESILDGQPLALCPQCDGNGDGQVVMNEVNLCRLGTQGCVPCRGDCDGSGKVTASDLVTAVSIIVRCPCEEGLGGIARGCPELPTTATECRTADRDADACIVPNELGPLITNIFRCGP